MRSYSEGLSWWSFGWFFSLEPSLMSSLVYWRLSAYRPSTEMVPDQPDRDSVSCLSWVESTSRASAQPVGRPGCSPIFPWTGDAERWMWWGCLWVLFQEHAECPSRPPTPDWRSTVIRTVFPVKVFQPASQFIPFQQQTIGILIEQHTKFFEGCINNSGLLL